MRLRLNVAVAAPALILYLSGGTASNSTRAEAPVPYDRAAPDATAARRAAEHGLAFLVKDASDWRKERQCATCHHGTMTVWALCEAKNQGYAVDAKSLKEIVSWTKERFMTTDRPRDSRMGWNMVNTPAVYLAVMAHTIPNQEELSGSDLQSISGHLLRHQESNGSWAWSIAPPANRPPPVFESDEVVTLMASVALTENASAVSPGNSLARDGLSKAATWLATNVHPNSTQAACIRLLRAIQDGAPRNQVRAATDVLLSQQNDDGGWGQESDLPSDAYATGQALYFLNVAGVPSDRAEIRRGLAYLVANQKEDGSWPMKSRAHPGATPMTNPVPITHSGSAWATLGLMRSTPISTRPGPPSLTSWSD